MEKQSLNDKLKFILNFFYLNYDKINKIVSENEDLKRENRQLKAMLDEKEKEIKRIAGIKDKAMKLINGILEELE